MNLNNVKVGDKFSTESKLIRALGEESKKGCSRISQLKEVRRYIRLEKTGKIVNGKVTNEIIIVEIYNKPLDKMDNRINNGKIRTLIKGYEVDKSLDSSIGVYCVELNNDIYIGSTATGFRKRFLKHNYSDSSAKKLIDKGGKFKVLFVMDGENEYTIRRKEKEYIDYFKKLKGYNLINIREETYCIKDKKFIKFNKKKLKKKKITNNPYCVKCGKILFYNKENNIMFCDKCNLKYELKIIEEN